MGRAYCKGSFLYCRPEPQRPVQGEGKEESKVYQAENDRAEDVPKSGWPREEKSSDWSQQQRKQETWTQQQSPKGHHTDPVYEIKQEVIQRR